MGIYIRTSIKKIATAKTKAKEINTLINIAVLNLGAHLVGFIRMKGVSFGSLEIAKKK